MARRAKADSDATAAAVRDAAQVLFAANGYADVGLEQVAAAAGVTRGAVYHHFTNKLGLFTAVLARYDSNRDFNEGVWLCAVAFVLAGVFALFVDARKPVLKEAEA